MNRSPSRLLAKGGGGVLELELQGGEELVGLDVSPDGWVQVETVLTGA